MTGIAHGPQYHQRLLESPGELQRHIRRQLFKNFRRAGGWPPDLVRSPRASGVLFLLGRRGHGGDKRAIYLILNKRSSRVRQAGDLCCPGGRIMPIADRMLSLFMIPIALNLRKAGVSRAQRRGLRIMWATALRESWEEMRINPFRLKYLGALEAYYLKMFDRYIFPVVGWIDPPLNFRPNWEIETLQYIAISDLLNVDSYARFRMVVKSEGTNPRFEPFYASQCFLHKEDGKREILWGATYWITMNFLGWVFCFTPPDPSGLPIVQKEFDKSYYSLD